MMKLAALLILSWFPAAIHAAASLSNIVECSKIKKVTNSTFTVCATAYYETPSPAMINDTTVYIGGFTDEYTILKGVRKGTDLGDLSEEELKWASVLDTVINVRREDNNRCRVTVTVKGNATQCTSCQFCGGLKYSANCLNVKNGRNVTCESTGTGRVYFPLTESALRMAKAPSVKRPPVANPVSTPQAPTAPKAPTSKYI
jgi:hypothetical protein